MSMAASDVVPGKPVKYAFGSHFRNFAVKRTKLSRVALVTPHADEVLGQCGVQATILLLTSTPSPFRHGSTKPITCSSYKVSDCNET